MGVKIGLRYSEPFLFAGLRFMLAGVVLVPLWVRTPTPISTLGANFRLILKIGFFQTFLLYGLFFYSLTLLPAALAAIVAGAAPLISAVAAHLLMENDRMTLPKTISILVGVVGIAIVTISRKPWSPVGMMEFVGVLVLLLGNVSSAVGNVMVAKEHDRIHPVLLCSAQLFFGGMMLMLFSILVEGTPHFKYPPVFYGALFYLVALSAAAFSIWFYLLQKPAVTVSGLNVWKFIVPVSGAILGWTLFPDESPTWTGIAGMVCVAVSILAFHLVNGNNWGVRHEKRQRLQPLAADALSRRQEIGTRKKIA